MCAPWICHPVLGFGTVASPSDERAQALHALAERVGVVVVSVPYVRETLEQARFFPGIPIDCLNALADALKVLTEVDTACRDCVTLFDRVRRVL